MILGEKIRQLRDARSMSQEKFAEEMNVSRQAVSKWELNQSIPEIDTLIEISDYFNVTLDYLIKNEDVTDKTVTVNENISNQEDLHEKKEFDEMLMLIPVILAIASIAVMNMGNIVPGSILAIVSCVIILGINYDKYEKTNIIIIQTAMVLALGSIKFMIMNDFIPGAVLAAVSCIIIIRINIAKHKKIKE